MLATELLGREAVAAIVGILLATVIVAILVYPFVRRKSGASVNTDLVDRVASADTLRHLLYREPVTLRNEYESGNITSDEYEGQLEELKLEAARLMRHRAEHRSRMIEAELAIELEVQRLRRQRAEDDAESDVTNA